jgi:hypothetical protein
MVFKYFDTSREYARKSLEQIICFNKIWLSSFDDFNDPYECYPTFTDELTKSYLKNLNKIMSWTKKHFTEKLGINKPINWLRVVDNKILRKQTRFTKANWLNG